MIRIRYITAANETQDTRDGCPPATGRSGPERKKSDIRLSYSERILKMDRVVGAGVVARATRAQAIKNRRKSLIKDQSYRRPPQLCEPVSA